MPEQRDSEKRKKKRRQRASKPCAHIRKDRAGEANLMTGEWPRKRGEDTSKKGRRARETGPQKIKQDKFPPPQKKKKEREREIKGKTG